MVAGAAILAATVLGGVVVASGGNGASAAAQDSPADTRTVEKGTLSDLVSLNGTLTYRARSDGSPYSAINRARGTYTELPEVGDEVHCGDVFYRVDDHPVLLLCGPVPAYRDLARGDVGKDVAQLNRNLHDLGCDAGAEIGPDDNVFTSKTQTALEKLQHDKGLDVTGGLAIDDAVFLPESVRIARVIGELGGSAQPGAQVVDATSDTLEVHVDLDPSQQGVLKEGDLAQITLPGNTSVSGKVDRLGRVAQIPAGQNGRPGAATLPAYISLDDPAKASGLDQAPVSVDITTAGVENALSVPVTALVGKSGGGFAVEVVRDDGRRELVAVKVGLFDDSAGRVEVEGDVVEGDHVVVPSS
jgi:hypothetical protein